MKLSDYLMEFLAGQGVREVFMLAGGGAMHLDDSLGHHPDLRPVCMLHEQAAAIAAESHGRVTGRPGVALVTSGPGATNAITGVVGAWQDSIPCLFISGQVKRADLVGDSGLRQLGAQEVDIVTLVASITCYAAVVDRGEDIRYHLEKAFHRATTGRGGPVWLDIPLDVQAQPIDPTTLRGFEPDEEGVSLDDAPPLDDLLERLSRAERPVLLLGNGVRLSGAASLVSDLVTHLGIPVLTTWPAMDLLPGDHPLFMGRPGPLAPRGANFTLQNADWLLAIGARLDRVLLGFSPEYFARGAWKAMVDIDRAELDKHRTLVDCRVRCDARRFIEALLARRGHAPWNDRAGWGPRCADWRTRYRIQTDDPAAEGLSTYRFAEVLSEVAREGDLIVPCSSGLAVEIFLLMFQPRRGQRVFNTTALGAMGYGVPAAIGAAVASPGQRVLTVDGDGGFFMNLQELEVARRLSLPIKLFVINNDGYASIRTSQSRYFERLTGADASSGMTLPDIRRVASAFGVEARRLDPLGDVRAQLQAVLDTPGPVVCEIPAPPEEPRVPSLASFQRPDGSMVSRPLEDLWPFLPRDEFLAQMIVPPVAASLEES